MHMHFLSVLLCLGLASGDHARTNQLPNRTTIVHLFEWKWKDIAEECERFLAPKGFGAVQISPPSENLIISMRPWYERYQVMSYTLETRSGNQEEFHDMTTRCNRVGVRIYADVVVNHMTGNADKDSRGTAGSTADFDNYIYPAVPYVYDNFHYPHCQINNYYNASEELNDMSDHLIVSNERCPQTSAGYEALPSFGQFPLFGSCDTFTNSTKRDAVAVTSRWYYEIDAAKHMHPDDLREIYKRIDNLNTDFGFAPNTRPYIYQEVIYYGGEPIRPDEYTPLGDVTEFRYGNELKNVFRGHNAMKWLLNWGEGWGLSPSATALVFIDNHDTQRSSDVLTYKESRAYKAAVAFMLAHPYGEPRIISSYFFNYPDQGPPSDHEKIVSPTINPNDTCGNGWVCEHRWRQIYQMVGFRNAVSNTRVTFWWDNGNKQIAFGREDKGFIVFNGEYARDLNITLKTGLPTGVYCDVISGQKKDGGCTGHKISINEYSHGHFYVSKDAEDMHIALHVGSESKL